MCVYILYSPKDSLSFFLERTLVILMATVWTYMFVNSGHFQQRESWLPFMALQIPQVFFLCIHLLICFCATSLQGPSRVKTASTTMHLDLLALPAGSSSGEFRYARAMMMMGNPLLKLQSGPLYFLNLWTLGCIN